VDSRDGAARRGPAWVAANATDGRTTLTPAPGLVGAPACGDVMKLQIRVENGVVVESKFKTFGCGSAIASSSVATEWVKGKSVDEVLGIKNSDIAKHLTLPPVKVRAGAREATPPRSRLTPAAAALLDARGGRHQGGGQGLEAEERQGVRAEA